MYEKNEQLSTSEWWAKYRFRYNIGFVVAGIVAFVLYAAVIFNFEERIPGADITIFTTAFQGVCYLLAMGVANIFYYLGPVSERIFKPKNIFIYRVITFNLGFYFSVLLPFSIPVSVGYIVAMRA
jgi:hypothetical protein